MNYYAYPGNYSLGSGYNGYMDMDCIIDPVGGKGGLWVGNYVAATDTDTLMRAGIRAVVTASSETAVNYDKQTIPFHIKIQALDYPSFSLEPYFEQVTDFIESQLQVTNVLVHCMAGISRSVSFTIAYLMKYKGLKFDEALSLIQSRRSIANPNDGFVTQLKRYRKYLKSKGKIYKTKSRTSSLQVPQNPERVSRLRSPSPVIYNPEETKSLLRPSTKQDLVNQMYFMGSNPPINGSFYPQSRDFYSNTLSISDISNNPQRQNRLTSWSPVLTSYNYRAY